MDIVNQWLEDMGKGLGHEIRLNEEGRCSIEFEDNVNIVFDSDEDSPVFYLSSPLMEIPADQDLALMLLANALSLNLFMIETRGATIAVAEDIGQVMICFMQEKESCDEKRFSAIIEGFYETARNIRQRLQDIVDTGKLEEGTGAPNVGAFV